MWPLAASGSGCCSGSASALADRLTPLLIAAVQAASSQNRASWMSRHDGGIEAPASARMLAVGPEAMQLEVDGSPVEVRFDHPLTDSEDAHRTLVAMLRAMPQG